MNMLLNPNIHFDYAGLFHSQDEWIHPARTEVTYEIIYVTQGVVHLQEGEREYALEKGQLLLLEPQVCHVGCRKSCNVGFYWVHFTVTAPLPFDARFFSRFDSAYLFRELLHYNNLPHQPDYAVNAILTHILARLCELSRQRTPQSNPLAEDIYDWIRANASASLRTGTVARRFGLSADHTARLLRKSFGMGTKAVIDLFLIKAAREQLCNTEKNIGEISYELGFSSDNAFISFFRYHENCYPSQYRKQFYKTHRNSR